VRLTRPGFVYKNKSEQAIALPLADIRTARWMKVARQQQLRLTKKDGFFETYGVAWPPCAPPCAPSAPRECQQPAPVIALALSETLKEAGPSQPERAA